MLIMFRVKNFTSFRDEIVLDLRKTAYKQHPNHIFKWKEFELLKTIAIYGANASGKSNLISALSSFEFFILNQLFKQGDEEYNSIPSDVEKKKISLAPFLLTKPINKEIEFEIVFGYNNRLFQYGYIVEENRINAEWLFIDNEVVFDRQKDNIIEFGEQYIEILDEYKKLREDRLYIALLDYFVTEEKVREIVDDFKEYFSKKYNVFYEIILETSVKGNSVIGFKGKLVEDEEFRKQVSKYIREIDVGIKEIIIDEEVLISKSTGKEERKPVPKALHDIYDSEGNIIGVEAFDLHQESSGTLRFLSFIQEILIMIEQGGTFVVDELSSRLHPLLTKFVVDLFQSEINKNNGQLIFVTHDVTIMNKEQFRRDEVVLIDKNEMGVSSLYSLADLDVKQDATFNKDYFRGKYGAIPIFREVKQEHGDSNV